MRLCRNTNCSCYECTCYSSGRCRKVCHAINGRAAYSAGYSALRGIQADVFPVLCCKLRQLLAFLEFSVNSKYKMRAALDCSRNACGARTFCSSWLALNIRSVPFRTIFQENVLFLFVNGILNFPLLHLLIPTQIRKALKEPVTSSEKH